MLSLCTVLIGDQCDCEGGSYVDVSPDKFSVRWELHNLAEPDRHDRHRPQLAVTLSYDSDRQLRRSLQESRFPPASRCIFKAAADFSKAFGVRAVPTKNLGTAGEMMEGPADENGKKSRSV